MSALLGLTKKYKGSKIEIDKLTDFFSDRQKFEPLQKQIISSSGYCIRTGKQIPFNPQKPMSDEAYQSWAKFANENYSEKYCHFSGELSNGATSFAKPILPKFWAKAKEIYNF